MNTTTETKKIPGRPVAPKAPSAPKAPQAPEAAKAAPKAPESPRFEEEKPPTPKNSAKEAPKAPKEAKAAPKATKAEPGQAELLAIIEGMKAQIAALASKRTANGLSGKTRTPSEILDGAPVLPKGDWRTEYHGYATHVKAFEWAKGEEGLALIPGVDNYSVLLAIPRDTDVGGAGAKARSIGSLALHYQMTEDGSFFGQPAYITAAELAEIWIDE